jgi:methyl-accepting chemotaxis protein
MSHDAGNAPSWIDQLGFAKKMALLGGLALLPLAITVSMLLSTALREVRIAQHQQAAVEVVAPLMPLVRSLQDHRGASRAWLAGDQTFKARVEQAQQRVNDAVAATQVTVDTAKDRIDVSKDWASLATQWRELAGRNAKLEPALSFKEHTAVIDEALRLFGTVADHGELLRQDNSAALRLADVLVERLPRLGERVGLTRGYGAGLLARDAQSVTPEERARLLSLVASARDLSEDVHQALGHARSINAALDGPVSGVLDGLKPIAAFLVQAEQRVAQPSTERPSAADYFAAGTDALKGVYSAHELLLPELRKQVDAHAVSVWQTAALMLAAVLLSLALCTAMAWWVYRRLRWALNAAVTSASAIADGKLEVAVPQGGRDEFGVLLGTLRTMTESLRTVVGGVRASATEINVAVTEVATGNVDLSQRTEQQAANLQQTSASMEELTSTVSNNAENARQANQLALGASEVARRGGEVVDQVVTTMGEISDSSHKIADIIGVIDGIAFQTNILALNAAVEAARAGEQGRGFAVVASEVRSLAQRSAQAAREIKTLITDSVQRVESGERLVKDAGATMQEIVTSVRRVTDIIGEISSATAEQSAGIAQVNTSVSELDRMTQQNAALVEEGAAASESLKDQAQRLIHTIDHFQIGASEAAPSMGRAPAKATVVASVNTAIASPKAALSQPAAPARQAKLAALPTALPAASPSPAMTSRPSTPPASAAAKPPPTVKALQAVTSPVVPKTVASAKPVVSPAPARTAAMASDDDWEEF